MKNGRFLFSSESVNEGHPDKICDIIADAILDRCLAQDPQTKASIEALVTTGTCFITGELTTSARVDFAKTARETIRRIGYDNPKKGFDFESCGVHVLVNKKKQGEETKGDCGGIVFGYATSETLELMPFPIMLARSLMKRFDEARKKQLIPNIGPVGKSQVTIEYYNGVARRLDSVVIAAQHCESMPIEEVRADVKKHIIEPVCQGLIDQKTKLFINSTGRFVLGGPAADTGVTGRKIICDTFGGVGSHGGESFSGKDPSKIERSAALMARYVAKNIVAAGLADKCEVQLAYAIGVAEPVSVLVHAFETNKIPEEKIEILARKNFPLKIEEIIDYLDLRKPIYEKTSVFGSFGCNDADFSWERTDKAMLLKKQAKMH